MTSSSRLIDLTGQRFGRLTVVSRAPNYGTSAAWFCICECGKTLENKIRAADLRKGHTKSCGCLAKELQAEKGRQMLYKHGHAGKHKQTREASPTYRSWASMHVRCRRPDRIYYAGRGIVVCERWDDFENFLADMGERPDGKTLDRYPDGDGNYEPGNCRWATHKEQAANRRPPVRRKKEASCHAQ
jgi:hypothetical protein